MQALELSNEQTITLIKEAVGPILRVVFYVFGFLMSSIVGLILYLYRSAVKYGEKYLKEKKEETAVFYNKFGAINEYMSKSNSRHAVHHEKITVLEKNYDKLEDKTQEHAKLIQTHDTEIKNLKKE